jgi:parallel beta-helix repeat protein
MVPRLVTLLLCLTGAPAVDYYVAPGGDDTNTGTSAGSPLATVTAALLKTASGDRVLLRRGGTYRGTFTLPTGRTLTAYDSGALPVVTACTLVTPTGGTIKTASVAAQVRALWIDGAFAPLARYPDSGWLTVDSGASATALVDAGLKARAAGRFTGAQVRWRRWSWWWETRPVTADNGTNTLTIGGTAQVDSGLVGIGSAYFLDNDLDELDADREWFWGGGILSVRVPAGATTVEVATSTTGITANGGIIENVAFHRFAGTALTLSGATTVRGCDFREIETDAVLGGWNAAGSLVTGNTFRDIRNCAIVWNENPAQAGGSIIERNQIERIGMEYGYGGSGSWHASGIILSTGKPVTVRLNRIIETGYCGIILGTDGNIVSRNVFVRCMGSLNDGGAVYANCDASIITENIILDTVGNLATSHPWTPLGHGIWVEYLSDFRDSELRDNTIYGSGGHGIFLPNNFSCDVTGNTCVDNRLGGLHLSDGGGHTISGNILGVVATTRRQTWPENLEAWASTIPSGLHYEAGTDFGNMTGTTFVVPTGQRVTRTGNTDQTLAQWQAANASWAGSATHIANHPIVLFNDTENTAAMTVPVGTWSDLTGSNVSGTLDVAPFRSVVLISTNAPATTPPYHAASGTDYRAPLAPPTTPTAPAITTHPTNTTVTAPDIAGMTITASGTQPLSYLWQRQPAGGGAWSTVPGVSGSTLTSPTSIADDGASYRCQVSNAAGSAISNTAVLSVLPATGGGSGGGGGGGGGGGCGLGSGSAALLALLAMAFAVARWAVRG